MRRSEAIDSVETYYGEATNENVDQCQAPTVEQLQNNVALTEEQTHALLIVRDRVVWHVFKDDVVHHISRSLCGDRLDLPSAVYLCIVRTQHELHLKQIVLLGLRQNVIDDDRGNGLHRRRRKAGRWRSGRFRDSLRGLSADAETAVPRRQVLLHPIIEAVRKQCEHLLDKDTTVMLT